MAINNFNVGVGTTSQLTRYRYVATGGETSISGTDADGKTLSYTVGLEQVFLNGVNLVRGQDYTATNGTSIGALTALVASDSLEVFAYVPFNIANALTVSTVDAKGDLLVGTGADTVGRLAVGANNLFLQAASGETTGLKWAGAFSTYTPVLFQNGVLATTTAIGRYLQIGKIVYGHVIVAANATGTSSNRVKVSLPITAQTENVFIPVGTGNFYDSSSTNVYPCHVVIENGTYFNFVISDVITTNGSQYVGVSGFTAAVAASDQLGFSFTYEVA